LPIVYHRHPIFPLSTIIDAKERGQTFQPLLLVQFTFNDGSVLRLSTHDLRQVGL
jgi:hypothetical protein